VIHHINSPPIDRSSCGLVIEDVKLLAKILNSVLFIMFIALKFAAHNLARKCESLVDTV
jgi:hypothetical protein